MSKRWLAVFTLLAALLFLTPSVMAKNDKSKGKGNPHANQAFDKHDKHADKHHDDDHGWERRDGFEHRIFEGGGRPPGWSRGNKTGWKNCGLPPGQAKKYGCRTYVYQGRPHYYYQDEVGRIIIRRPMVHVHAGVDIVR
jgi:hypothetical protein